MNKRNVLIEIFIDAKAVETIILELERTAVARWFYHGSDAITK